MEKLIIVCGTGEAERTGVAGGECTKRRSGGRGEVKPGTAGRVGEIDAQSRIGLNLSHCRSIDVERRSNGEDAEKITVRVLMLVRWDEVSLTQGSRDQEDQLRRP